MYSLNENYGKIINKIFNAKPSSQHLQTLPKILNLLSIPYIKMNFIHVAGTNGKGSVCTKLSSIFEKSGYKTGLFTSPHVNSYRERIKINSTMIDKESIIKSFNLIEKVAKENFFQLGFFEYTFVICLKHFYDNEVDIGIIETGCGGRVDYTNIINPMMSVITSIGIDHKELLGPTIRDIAYHKAGIIKERKPVVLGIDIEPLDIFEDEAKGRNAPLFQVKQLIDSSLYYDYENRATAELAIKKFVDFYPEMSIKITENAISEGLKERPICRNEKVFKSISKEKCLKVLLNQVSNTNKLVENHGRLFSIILDVCHNIHGFEKYLRYLRNKYSNKKLRVILGISKKDEIEKFLLLIMKFADFVHLVESSGFKKVNYDLMIETLVNLKQTYTINENMFVVDEEIKGNVKLNLLKAIDEIVTKEEDEEEVLVCCGSFFIMTEIRQVLGYEDEKDSDFL